MVKTNRCLFFTPLKCEKLSHTNGELLSERSFRDSSLLSSYDCTTTGSCCCLKYQDPNGRWEENVKKAYLCIKCLRQKGKHIPFVHIVFVKTYMGPLRSKGDWVMMESSARQLHNIKSNHKSLMISQLSLTHENSRNTLCVFSFVTSCVWGTCLN